MDSSHSLCLRVLLCTARHCPTVLTGSLSLSLSLLLGPSLPRSAIFLTYPTRQLLPANVACTAWPRYRLRCKQSRWRLGHWTLADSSLLPSQQCVRMATWISPEQMPKPVELCPDPNLQGSSKPTDFSVFLEQQEVNITPLFTRKQRAHVWCI